MGAWAFTSSLRRASAALTQQSRTTSGRSRLQRGWNDRRDTRGWEHVHRAIDEHAAWYRKKGCLLAFTEPIDHQGNNGTKVTTYLK